MEGTAHLCIVRRVEVRNSTGVEHFAHPFFSHAIARHPFAWPAGENPRFQQP